MRFVLYNQCRSGPSHRVRIALALKQIDYRYVAVDIRSGEQFGESFQTINPQRLVPALDTSNGILTQSGAIIEWLDEAYPEPPLLPSDPKSRAIVRGQAAIIGSDIQPLNNLRVREYLQRPFGANTDSIRAWTHHWIEAGFDALEISAQRYGDGYLFGASPTIADVFLIPQIAMAKRLEFDMGGYPLLSAIFDHAGRHAAFRAARAEVQPDYSD